MLKWTAPKLYFKGLLFSHVCIYPIFESFEKEYVMHIRQLNTEEQDNVFNSLMFDS